MRVAPFRGISTQKGADIYDLIGRGLFTPLTLKRCDQVQVGWVDPVRSLQNKDCVHQHVAYILELLIHRVIPHHHLILCT